MTLSLNYPDEYATIMVTKAIFKHIPKCVKIVSLCHKIVLAQKAVKHALKWMKCNRLEIKYCYLHIAKELELRLFDYLIRWFHI